MRTVCTIYVLTVRLRIMQAVPLANILATRGSEIRNLALSEFYSLRSLLRTLDTAHD